MITRRRALGRAAAAGGALAVTGALSPLALAQEEDEATALASVLSLQQTTLVAYGALASGGLLGTRAARIMRLLRDHEREQVAALTEALEGAGGEPPDPPSPQGVEGLAELRSQEQALRLAIDLETQAVAACYDAVGQLRSATALLTVAGVMAADAQHLVLLREAAGAQPLPEAFVTGAPVG